MQLEAAVPPRLPDGSLPLPVLLQSPATDVTPPAPQSSQLPRNHGFGGGTQDTLRGPT